MESLIEKILTQGSPLVVLVLIVWMMVEKFLKAASEARNEFLKHQTEARQTWVTEVVGLHREHLDARNQMRTVLESVAESSNKLSTAILEASIRADGSANRAAQEIARHQPK